MKDVSNMRPVDAFTVAQHAVEHMQRFEWDAAFQVMDLDPAWLEDSTLVEVAKIATARVNEYLARAGLPLALMPADPTEED